MAKSLTADRMFKIFLIQEDLSRDEFCTKTGLSLQYLNQMVGGQSKWTEAYVDVICGEMSEADATEFRALVGPDIARSRESVKDGITILTQFTPDDSAWIREYSAKENLTLAKVVRLCVRAFRDAQHMEAMNG